MDAETNPILFKQKVHSHFYVEAKIVLNVYLMSNYKALTFSSLVHILGNLSLKIILLKVLDFKAILSDCRVARNFVRILSFG